MIERAQRVPYLETLAMLANALGITLSQLFLGVHEPRAKDGQAEVPPLIAYLGNLRLHPGDIELLLSIAKAMFDGRP